MSEILNINHHFPKQVKSYCCGVQDYTKKLTPEELSIISKAINKRRYEFSTGRLCARKALLQIGIDNCVLTQGKKGEPIWPDLITGTISHSKKRAAAAVSKTEDIMGIGLDIETVGRINDRMLNRIITDREKEQLKGMNKQQSLGYASLIFSAKEAFYKALSSKYNGALRFKDISIISNDDSPEFGIDTNNELKSFLKNVRPFCRYFINENDIFTAITFPEF